MSARELRPPGNQRTGLLELAGYLPDRCVGVEIGSYAGESAEIFVKTGKFKTLVCVDPWPLTRAHLRMAEGEQEFDEVCARHPEIRKLKERSLVAAAMFEDTSFDFGYIDANHAYEFVRPDIVAWLPKIKPGGILAGHDYSPRFDGVRRAVNEIFGKPERVFCDTSWMVRVP